MDSEADEYNQEDLITPLPESRNRVTISSEHDNRMKRKNTFLRSGSILRLRITEADADPLYNEPLDNAVENALMRNAEIEQCSHEDTFWGIGKSSH